MKLFSHISVSSVLLLSLFTAGGGMYAQSRGTVSGKVELAAQAEAPKKNLRRQYGHADHLSKAESSENSFDDVVVYLEEVSSRKTYSPSGRPPSLSQKNATFIPRVLPILKGTTVMIKNEDNIYHNVFSLSDSRSFNIGRRPMGESVPVSFDKPGEVRVFCDIHSNMSAYILVLENPYFVKPNSQGYYSIKDIPSGTYRVKAWHPRLKADPLPVETGGDEKTVNVQMR